MATSLAAAPLQAPETRSDPAVVDLTATKPLDYVRLQELMAQVAARRAGQRGPRTPDQLEEEGNRA